jgi:drug/metabolite transporter (DMT)-like permease
MLYQAFYLHSLKLKVTSILAGLINAVTPLMTLLAIMVAFREEKIKAYQVVTSLLTGFMGVLVVLGAWQGLGVAIQSRIGSGTFVSCNLLWSFISVLSQILITPQNSGRIFGCWTINNRGSNFFPYFISDGNREWPTNWSGISDACSWSIGIGFCLHLEL